MIIQASGETRLWLQKIVGGRIVTFSAPSGMERLKNQQAFVNGELVMEVDTPAGRETVEFGVDIVDIGPKLEAFLVAAGPHKPYRTRPHVSPTSDALLQSLNDACTGATIEDVRFLRARWEASVPEDVPPGLYGRNPVMFNSVLVPDTALPADATHEIEDGLALFLSEGRLLVLSTHNVMPCNIAIWFAQPFAPQANQVTANSSRIKTGPNTP